MNDEPNTFGAAHRRDDSRDRVAASVFEEFRRGKDGRFEAVVAIEKLLKEVRAKYVILSYSSGGRATAEDLSKAISAAGDIISMREIDYKKNVMTGMRWTDEWIPNVEKKNIEYLFLIEK
ncbi:MAG: hypothetical protein GDA47_00495 [Rhodospirillales bacterium]|nr:hypothetical protein [Rhodospirillales bacterium]